MAIPLVLRAGSLAARRKQFRDATGRFAKAPTDATAVSAAALTYGAPGSHKGCGKKQYKSLECKSRSIRKAAGERGEATEREAPYIRWLYQYGE